MQQGPQVPNPRTDKKTAIFAGKGKLECAGKKTAIFDGKGKLESATENPLNFSLTRGQPQPQPPLHPQRDQDHNARQQAPQQTGTIFADGGGQGNTADHTYRL